MGSYTDPQNFYLIDGSELVSVEQDLNYNLKRADDRVRPLVEYLVTDEPTITTSSLPKDTGFKWYKTYTGAIYHYRGGIFQDINASIDTWSVSGLSFESGYGSLDQEENRIAFSLTPDGFVRWRGRLVLDNQASELPLNTTINFLTPPASVLPVRARYFTLYGGNASGTDFQCFRLFVPQAGAADTRLEFVKYGSTASSSGERYLSLNDVYYALNDNP